MTIFPAQISGNTSSSLSRATSALNKSKELNHAAPDVNVKNQVRGQQPHLAVSGTTSNDLLAGDSFGKTREFGMPMSPQDSDDFENPLRQQFNSNMIQ